ncbi:hypothetical protein ATANTOWER_018077 [Ataeniobius toweri]|uniref:Uncharacterized protein n=1 Tax=Ataeniobius toweri TaxID=208326 RepID=A0ABU7AV95_9TELE|nr:hypothetical protein [Ataeniobius toweri]
MNLPEKASFVVNGAVRPEFVCGAGRVELQVGLLLPHPIFLPLTGRVAFFPLADPALRCMHVLCGAYSFCHNTTWSNSAKHSQEILGCMLTDSTLQIFRVPYLIIYNSNINLLLNSNETVIRCMEREAGGCLCASITDSMHLPLFVK